MEASGNNRGGKPSTFQILSWSGTAAALTALCYLFGYLRVQFLLDEVDLAVLPTDVYERFQLMFSGGVLLLRASLFPGILFLGTLGILARTRITKPKRRQLAMISCLAGSVGLFLLWQFGLYRPDKCPTAEFLFPMLYRSYSPVLLIVGLCSLPFLAVILFLWQRRAVTVSIACVAFLVVFSIALQDAKVTSRNATLGATMTNYLYPAAVYGVLYTRTPVCAESESVALSLMDETHIEPLYSVGGMVLNHSNGLWYLVPGWGGAWYKAEKNKHSAWHQLLVVPDSSVVSLRVSSRE